VDSVTFMRLSGRSPRLKSPVAALAEEEAALAHRGRAMEKEHAVEMAKLEKNGGVIRPGPPPQRADCACSETEAIYRPKVTFAAEFFAGRWSAEGTSAE
jgi:hypothetical protein